MVRKVVLSSKGKGDTLVLAKAVFLQINLEAFTENVVALYRLDFGILIRTYSLFVLFRIIYYAIEAIDIENVLGRVV